MNANHVKIGYKPKLTVLIRSKKEEAVLTGCKHYTATEGPAWSHYWCSDSGCTDCAEQVVS